MPAWSPEIANEFVRLSQVNGQSFDQMQLQKLVYIAHGFCLAFLNQPLTGDRPEAWPFGPVYKRLSKALAHYGSEPVAHEIQFVDSLTDGNARFLHAPTRAELIPSEMDTILLVYKDFGRLSSGQLASLTQTKETPWFQVFADGAGQSRDIPHDLVRAQFVQFAKASENP